MLEGLEFRMGFILESLRFPFNFYRNTNAPLPAACLSLVDAGRICACYDKETFLPSNKSCSGQVGFELDSGFRTLWTPK